MPKTTIIFFDTSLELVPKKVQHNELIKKNAKKKGKLPSKIILDSSYHYKAIQNLPNSKKRGRPDIIHFCLLNILGSRLVKEGKYDIEIYIHTLGDLLIKVNKNVRVPRNYNRFIGLMEQLLVTGEIKSKEEILFSILYNTKIEQILAKSDEKDSLLLTRSGTKVNVFDCLISRKEDDLLFAIGAFPYGNAQKYLDSFFTNRISISNIPMDAWTVVSEIAIIRNYTMKL